MTLDREKLKKLGIEVVEPTAEDEKTAVVHFVSKDAVEAMKASFKGEDES